MVLASEIIKVGDRVRLEWDMGPEEGIDGTIEAIDPCDGNGCSEFPHEPNALCGDDYVILAEDDQMAYYRWQVVEVVR